MFDIKKAKKAITITEAWERLGCPGKPGKSCRAPDREDKNPSFSIYVHEGTGEERYYDHATGEHGDVVDFVARVLGLDLSEAAKLVIKWAGLSNGSSKGAMSRGGGKFRYVSGGVPPKKQVDSLSQKPLSPSSRGLGNGDVALIAKLRSLPENAVELAKQRGHLRLGRHAGHDCWITLDQAKLNVRFRTMTGKRFHGKIKEQCLKGSKVKFPIGWLEASKAKGVLLVEGTPDFLAAHAVLPSLSWRVVAVAGRGMALPQEFLGNMKGMPVLVIPHLDEDGGGCEAALKWVEQLKESGAQVGIVNLEPILERRSDFLGNLGPKGPFGDLNDAVSFDVDAVKALVGEGGAS